MYMHTKPATDTTSTTKTVNGPTTAVAPEPVIKKKGFAKERLRGGKDRNNFTIVLASDEGPAAKSSSSPSSSEDEEEED